MPNIAQPEESPDRATARRELLASLSLGFPLCPNCGYDLSGTLERPDRICPECGRPWTIDELALQRMTAIQWRRSAADWLIWALAPGIVLPVAVFVGLILAGVSGMLGILITCTWVLLLLVILIRWVQVWTRDILHVLLSRRWSIRSRWVGTIGVICILFLINSAETAGVAWGLILVMRGFQ